MKNDEFYLSKMNYDLIELKSYSSSILGGLCEIAGKLDALIALKQTEIALLQQRQEPQQK